MEIWQPGFREWTVRDAKDFQIKADYIRMNPVEAKMVETPQEWAYSSARGIFSLDEAPEDFASEAKASLSRIAYSRS